ncbi:hypothetical protein NKI80_18880 [Mesorhizobium sp. M0387]|uniref:hypothetical protein n=1 Tax=Mesorhizobium sp. M0387 TaxID=2956940 RepID=UPI00333D1CF6
MTQLVNVQLNLDNVREIANLGVRRAAVFMGIGLNASQTDPPISHVLGGGMQFAVVPDDQPAEQQKAFVEEFGRWVIANGFRELTETFSVFLCEVFGGALLLHQDQIAFSDYQRDLRRFSRLGVSEQLKKAFEKLAIDAPFSVMFETMNDARNCMAHRRGVVSTADTDGAETFVLRWRGLALTLANGLDIVPWLISGEGFHTKDGGLLSLGMVDREKAFAVGEPITLTRYDLQEFCLAVQVAAAVVADGLQNLAIQKGKLPATPAAPTPSQTV